MVTSFIFKISNNNFSIIFTIAILHSCLFSCLLTQKILKSTSRLHRTFNIEGIRSLRTTVVDHFPTVVPFDNRFFDNPTGDLYAFRHIDFEVYKENFKSGENNSSTILSCQIWLCRNDFSGCHKAFSVPFAKEIESWDEIIWINDDLLYYAGFSYRPSMRKKMWNFVGAVTAIPRAHEYSVHDQKLYVSVRQNASQYLERNDVSSQGAGGFFWLNPSAERRPRLCSIVSMKDLVPHFNGKLANAAAIYISPNPSDTKLYLVVYDVSVRKEFAFIFDSKRGAVHKFLGETTSSRGARPVWIDDETFLSMEDQNPIAYSAYGIGVYQPLQMGKLHSIAPSSDRIFWVGIGEDFSIQLFRFGHSQSIEIVKSAHYENPLPYFSRNDQYVYYRGKTSPHANISFHRCDVSLPMVKLYYGDHKNKNERNTISTSYYTGKQIFADWKLSGQYRGATVEDILFENKAIKVNFNCDGSVQTLPFDHVRENLSDGKRQPIAVNSTVIANRNLRGLYREGVVHEKYPSKGLLKIQYASDSKLESLRTYHVRLHWQSLNQKGRLSARYLGFTEETWNNGTRVWSLPLLNNSDSIREKAAMYLGIEKQYIASSSVDQICFITASYGANTSDFTPHRDVTDFLRNNPFYSFFLFTNFDDLPARGWTKIVTHMPFKRFITHARYGKFLAWKVPEIQTSCNVIFWVDTTLFPKDDPFLWKNLADDILRSKYGLLQVPHKRVPEAQKYGGNVLLIEMRAILAAQKDLPENMMALWNWFTSENAFATNDYFLYENNFFGYDPKNPHFQRVSNSFWKQYSQEKESWRDQPQWAYYMHKERISPLLIRRKELFDYCYQVTATGHNGHKYSGDSRNDAHLWYLAKKWSTRKKSNSSFALPSPVEEDNFVQKSKKCSLAGWMPQNCSSQTIVNTKWAELERLGKDAALTLGFSENIWNLGHDLPFLHTTTKNLSADQMLAAIYLGFEIPEKEKQNSSRIEEESTKKLFFICQNPRFGSATMRGTQFIDEWNRGHEKEQENANEWVYSVHHCDNIIPCADVCVFIGPCDSPKLPSESCCKVKVLDIIDKYLYKRDIIDASLDMYDALVVNNNFMETHFREERNFSGSILVLPHHSDPRWNETKIEHKLTTKSLTFGFIGSLPSLQHTDNLLHWEELIEHYPITLVDTDQGDLPASIDFECDLSIRPINNSISQFKTSAKVATAAAMGRNIITTLDEAVKDCVPPNYPFLLKDSSLSAVKEMMNKAMLDYKSDRVLWNDAKRIMKKVNDTLSLSRLAIMYHNFLINLAHRQNKQKFDPKKLVECKEGEMRYFRMNPDVKKNWNGSAFSHYKKFGDKEGRFYVC